MPKPIINPPTIHDLLSDPVYALYVAATPARHPLLEGTAAWQVWVRDDTNRWRFGMKDEYADALDLAHRQMARGAEDVAIVSRRVFYGPPGEWRKYKARVPAKPKLNIPEQVEIREKWVPTMTWDAGLEWCARCRRPSSFRLLTENHHAMRHQPVRSDDEPARCYYCGIRRAAMPRDPYSLEI